MRQTYPIPNGYRMLEDLEIILATDLAWTETGPDAGEFQTVGEGSHLVHNKADRAICIIRYDARYLLEDVE